MNDFFKKYGRNAAMDIAMVVVFLLISFVYFQTPITQGMELGGHDSDAAMNQGREQADYRASHDGETSRWTNAMFSGMPTYQIAPSYSATQFLAHISDIYNLGTKGALCYVFVFLLGFYVMLRAFNFRPYLAALGAIIWAFSSYFFIIIAAGHIWKVMTLAYIPPTIGGLILCYRGRLLWGGAVTALFTAMQVLSNHVQMTYYFLFVMGLIVVAYGIQALRRKDDGLGNGVLSPKRWLKATGVIVVAGILGVAANLPNLYHTYDYAKHTMRGGSELTPLPTAKQSGDGAEASKGGLNYDYITQWSYGVDETMTLLIPNFKGGGTKSAITEENVFDEPYSTVYQHIAPVGQYFSQNPAVASRVSAMPGQNQYWGDQPFTVGPVYVGAFVCFLFVFALFVVRGPLKWAMAAATLVSLFFAWGHNVPGVTHFLIDHLPMYNKFRTVSSALVIAEFTMPLLGIMALAYALRHRDVLSTLRGKIGLGVATIVTAGLCLLFWLAPTAFGPLLSADEVATMDLLAKTGAFDANFLGSYTDAINVMRGAVLSASAFRSLIVLIVCGGIFLLGTRIKQIPAWATCGALALVALVDMWTVNRHYLNDDNFTDPIVRSENMAQKTAADEQILSDPDPDYRVLNYTVGNPFSENSTSYWHKNIGGYHAAKLQRYQDLIERHLNQEHAAFYQALTQTGDVEALNLDSLVPVLNMLNAKYFIVTKDIAVKNPAANGHGWFVGKLNFVKGADAEMAGLTNLDTKHAAVADEQFRQQLDGSALSNGTVTLTAYEPNELHYDVESDKGGVVVFSEVYYPGWTATIDGQSAEVGRVNYVLRALKVPAGKHKVVFEFRPASVSTTNTLAYVAIFAILALFVAALVITFKHKK